MWEASTGFRKVSYEPQLNAESRAGCWVAPGRLVLKPDLEPLVAAATAKAVRETMRSSTRVLRAVFLFMCLLG